MRFIGIDRDGDGVSKQFDCEDSEIATARVGFMVDGINPDELGLPQPDLEGKAIDTQTAEQIVSGNVKLLKSLGSVGLAEQRKDLIAAVNSGIEALEQAASESC